MDNVNDQKDGLNHALRQNALNFIMKNLMAWNKNPTNPTVVTKIRDIANRFEAMMYKKATSKDDYVAIVRNKLTATMASKAPYADAAASTAENQPMSNMSQRQTVHSNQSSQQGFTASSSSLRQNHSLLPSTPHTIHTPPMPMSTAPSSTMQQSNVGMPSSTMQPRNVDMSSSTMQQRTDTMQGQNVNLRNNLQHQSVLHNSPNRPMKEPIWPTDMSNRGSYQQPSQLVNPSVKVEQGIRLQDSGAQRSHILPSTGSVQQPSQLRRVKQEQGIQIHDTSVQKSHTSSTPLYPQTSVVPHPQVACTKAPSENASVADRKLVMTQYLRAKTLYFPELIRVYKRIEEESAKAQGVFDSEKVERLGAIRRVCEHHIKFLRFSENDLQRFSKEVICRSLDQVTNFLNTINKPSTISVKRNEVPQVSNGPVSVNQLQNTPPVLHASATTVSHPVISSSTKDKVFSYSQSNNPVLPLYGSPNTTKGIDMQTVLNKGKSCQGTSEHDTQTTLKRNLEPTQLSNMDQPLNKQQSMNPRKLPKEKDFMDSMFIPSTKVTARNAQGRPSRAHLPATKQPPLQTRNTLCVSDPREMLQHNPSTVAVDSALTPVNQSSVPKEIKKPAESSVPSTEHGVVTTKHQTDVKDKPVELGTSETIVSPSPSDISGAESNQLQCSEMSSVQRLVRAVETAFENGTLKDTVNDMAAAINDMDKLPEKAYASYDETNYSLFDEDMDNFLQGIDYVTGGEDIPRRKMKRDFDITSRDISTTLDDHKTRVVHPNHNLVVAEVREANRRLMETCVEVLSGSESDSSEGTIVRCTYKPMAFSDESKKRLAPIIPLATLSVDILVPASYPESPLKVLDRSLPTDGSNLETEDVRGLAKSMFNYRVRDCVLSLEEMAKAWDKCARQTFDEVARKHEVETFSSIFGSWTRV